MKKLPLSITSFSEIVNDNYLYIDKTKDIYNLINGPKYLFLSRPRRFGKSLLVSTLAEIFSGNKELFKDLDIYFSDHDWKKYPILRLDFSRALRFETGDLFELTFKTKLQGIAQLYNINLQSTDIISIIDEIIRELSKIAKVVILIDEYDAPMLNSINNTEEMEKIRAILRSFYSTIKGLNDYIHKFFMTGVTKIAQTSLFSGANQVSDISLDEPFQSILGYTQGELDIYFRDRIEHVSIILDISIQQLRENIKLWYNGYNFSETIKKVYNPFSILTFFDKVASRTKNPYQNYWIKTGATNFLIHTAQKNITSLLNITNKLINEKPIAINQNKLESFAVENVPLDSLLFQAGYLTISNYKDNKYELYYPNNEVKESLEKYLLSALTTGKVETIDDNIALLKEGLTENRLTQFFSELTKLIIDLPFDLQIEQERYYHSIIHMLAYLFKFRHITEEHTHSGILDLNIETEYFVFLFEFKINKTAKEALKQIYDKKYYLNYLDSTKPVTVVGASFNKVNNATIIDWQALPLDQFISEYKK